MEGRGPVATSTRSRSTAASKTAATKSTVKKAAPAKTAAKSAAKAGGSRAATPTKATTKKAAPAKTVAKTAAKKAPAKKAARTQVTFEGKPAKNRHFEVSIANAEAAKARADDEGVSISDVMRAGLKDYAKKTPAAAKRSERERLLLPTSGVRGLRKMFQTGRSEMISGYMAALANAGWPLQAIADSVTEDGLAETMTRQAVSLRVNKANSAEGGLPEGLPEV